MKTAATLTAEEMALLLPLLESEQIPCQTQPTSAESGLDLTDVLVDDGDYERACDLIENWQVARAEEITRKRVPRCPKCKSQAWEKVQDDHYEEAGLTVFRCQSCGALVPG